MALGRKPLHRLWRNWPGQITIPPSFQNASTVFCQYKEKTVWTIKISRYIDITVLSWLAVSTWGGEFLNEDPQIVYEYIVHYDKADSLLPNSLLYCWWPYSVAKVFIWDDVKGSLSRHCFFSKYLGGGMFHWLNYRNNWTVLRFLRASQVHDFMNNQQFNLYDVKPLEYEQEDLYGWSSLLTPFSPSVVADFELTEPDLQALTFSSNSITKER